MLKRCEPPVADELQERNVAPETGSVRDECAASKTAVSSSHDTSVVRSCGRTGQHGPGCLRARSRQGTDGPPERRMLLRLGIALLSLALSSSRPSTAGVRFQPEVGVQDLSRPYESPEPPTFRMQTSRRLLVAVGSQGWTPETQSLVHAMMALQHRAALYVHLGDVDFSFGRGTICSSDRFPEQRWLCIAPDGRRRQATPQEQRRGYRAIMRGLLPHPTVPWLIAVGHHEKDGMKRGLVQPYYATFFPYLRLGKPYYRAVNWVTPGAEILLVFIDTNEGLQPNSRQFTWLDHVFATHPRATWKVVFAHGQPWSTIKPHGKSPLRTVPAWRRALRSVREFAQRVGFDRSNRLGGDRSYITELMNKHKVDIWMGGHPLGWERTEPLSSTLVDRDRVAAPRGAREVTQRHDTIFIGNGGGGMHPCGTYGMPRPLPLKRWVAALVCGEPTFGTMEISANGKVLTVRAVSSEGGVRDEVTIRCAGYPCVDCQRHRPVCR